MASKDQKDPLIKLVDKLRSFLGFGNHPRKQTGMPSKTRFSIWYFVFAMILFSYLQPLLFSSKIETISCSQFKQYVKQGITGELIIGPENIKGTLAGSPKRAFATVRVNDPGLVKELDERKTSYSGRHENRFLSSLLSWVLPLGIFFLIWRFAMKKMGTGMGGMSLSKSKAKIFAETDTKVSFADVAGLLMTTEAMIADKSKKGTSLGARHAIGGLVIDWKPPL